MNCDGRMSQEWDRVVTSKGLTKEGKMNICKRRNEMAMGIRLGGNTPMMAKFRVQTPGWDEEHASMIAKFRSGAS